MRVSHAWLHMTSKLLWVDVDCYHDEQARAMIACPSSQGARLYRLSFSESCSARIATEVVRRFSSVQVLEVKGMDRIGSLLLQRAVRGKSHSPSIRR